MGADIVELAACMRHRGPDSTGFSRFAREEVRMATDYDASRKSEDEQKEESLDARRLTSGEHN